MTGKKTIIKFISSLLIITILTPVFLFSKPKPVSAQMATHDWVVSLFTGGTAGSSAATATATTTGTAVALKKVAKEILQQVIMTVQKRLLASFTTSTVNWINSGFHGSPLFVENPSSFFRDVAKFEIRDFIDMTGYDNSRFPFGKDFALSTIRAYKRQFADNARYTLSEVMTDPNELERFRTDFEIGGWNGFLINTQYPQNNYLGYRLMATEELARRLDGTAVNKANRVQQTLQQGMGFLSPKTCPSNPNYNNGINEFKQPTGFKPSVEFKFVPPPNTGAVLETGEFDFNQCLQDGTDFNECEAKRDEANAKFQEYNFGEQNDAYNKAKAEYDAKVAKERENFYKNSFCPGGLVATTPGSVVANQITTALGSTFRQTELGAALGNSLSAVFDALLNKFIGDGLTSLATKVNPKPQLDEWSYEGQTLGNPTDNTNDAWNTGPDEEIILDRFKKQIEGKTIVTTNIRTDGGVEGSIGNTTGAVTTGNTTTTTTEEVGNTRGCTYSRNLGIWTCPSGAFTYIPGDIANTEKELELMYNEASSNPGLIQVMGEIWPKSRELDICQPGPDLGWQDRAFSEMERNSKKLQGKVSDNDGEKAAQAQLALKELRFAVDFLKDWIVNNMMKSLPSSVLYMDAVEEIETLTQQSEELIDQRRTKNQALARLQAIKSGLDSITRFDSNDNIIQPETGSADERILISLRKQYNAAKIGMSTSTSVDDMKNELTIAKEKLSKLNKLVTQCKQERVGRGWSESGGPSSTITNPKTNQSATEKNIFCDDPIKGGYDHETFTHNNDNPSINPVTHPEIPYVNARDVMNWRSIGRTILCFGFCGRVRVNIQMDCGIIWKSNILDYKGSLPGTTQYIPAYQELPKENSGLGTCTLEARDPVTGDIGTDVQYDVTEAQCDADLVEAGATGTWMPNWASGEQLQQ